MLVNSIGSSWCGAGVAAQLSHAARLLPAHVRSTHHVAQQLSHACRPPGPLIDTGGHGWVKGQQQQGHAQDELARLASAFPQEVYHHLRALLPCRSANNAAPSALAMSCAAVAAAGSELSKHGFRVAEVCPPLTATPHAATPTYAALFGSSSSSSAEHSHQQHHPQHHAHHAPGAHDLVALLPGPRHLADAAPLLGAARRHLAAEGLLVVAWNDRDLSSPFMADLEGLLEGVNPTYCRTAAQHAPPAVLSALRCSSSQDEDGGGDSTSSGATCTTAAAGRTSTPDDDDAPLRLASYASFQHTLCLPRSGALADLLVHGCDAVRPATAASSAHRKAFHQAVRELVRRHFGSDGGAPLELPLISRLYVMSPPACHASSHPGTSSSSSLALHTRSHHGNGNCSHGRCSCKHTYA